MYCVLCLRVQGEQGYAKLKKAVEHSKSIVGITKAVHQEMLGCFNGITSTVAERVNCVCKVVSKFMLLNAKKDEKSCFYFFRAYSLKMKTLQCVEFRCFDYSKHSIEFCHGNFLISE